MNHLDLFSGIGGFALAVDRVWPNSKHIFCDNDTFCQEILKKHWPNSKIYEDIRTITSDTKYNGNATAKDSGSDSSPQPESKAREELPKSKSAGTGSIWNEKTRWDILTGGFPCQPFSQAGKRRGTEDNRYLWPEMFRVIQFTKPTWIIAENVGGLVTWNEGMVLEQVCLDLESEGYEVQPFIIPAVAVNAPHRRDRVWIVANKSSERLEGSNRVQRGRCTKTNINASNSESRKSREQTKQKGWKDFSRRDWETNWIEVATELCGVFNGLPKRLDRNPRLKALGNAIVPQVAEKIMLNISII